MVQSCHLELKENCSPQLLEKVMSGLKVREGVSPVFIPLYEVEIFWFEWTLVDQHKSQYYSSISHTRQWKSVSTNILL